MGSLQRGPYGVWSTYIPDASKPQLVVKNAKTITFFSDFPTRRVQIVLRLLPTAADVLLQFDLDACAIGFDGSRVFMLPRCARAIETGYSTFSMALIRGHPSSDRRATGECRALKYANRGFGIRILPLYARYLESAHKSTAWTHDQLLGESSRKVLQTNRYPYGYDEPGLKTLKRMAYLAKDFVERFNHGVSPLNISPATYQTQIGGAMVMNTDAEREWLESYQLAEQALQEPKATEEYKARCKHAHPQGPTLR